MAGIGFMSDGNTKENYEAVQIPENILIMNNTMTRQNMAFVAGKLCCPQQYHIQY